MTIKSSASTKILKVEHLNKFDINKRVKEGIQAFVDELIRSKYDVIIPIEAEGLSLIIPWVSDLRLKEKVQIIPSGSLEDIKPEKLSGKKILILEASVQTGGKLRDLASLVQTRIGAKSPPDQAAFIVQDSYPYHKSLALKKYLYLTQNQYEWAREELAHYFLENVFLHYGDPPFWELKTDPSTISELKRFLGNLKNVYTVPEKVSREYSWTRYSVSRMSFNVSQRFQDCRFLVPTESKLRILIHKEKPVVRFLPLTFVKVPSKLENVNLYSELDCFSSLFPKKFREVREFSKSVPGTGKNLFRWATTMFSLLLVNDFFKALQNSGAQIQLNLVRMIAPVPNLYQYSCSQDILKALEELMQETLETHSGKGQQAALYEPSFDIGVQDPVGSLDQEGDLLSNPFLVREPFQEYSPEQFLKLVFSRWLIDVETRQIQKAVKKQEIKTGLTAARIIRSYGEKLHILGLERALDYQVDNGVLKPRIDEYKEFFTRTYTISTESVRQYLSFFGKSIVMAGVINPLEED